MEYTIEKQVVKVPTEVVVLNGVRLDWSEFFGVTLRALQAIGPGKTRRYPEGIDRRELRHLLENAFDENWIKGWVERGVIQIYNYDWDNDGRTITTERLRPGVGYKPFMSAVAAFQKTVDAERAATALNARRKNLQAQLRALTPSRIPGGGGVLDAQSAWEESHEV